MKLPTRLHKCAIVCWILLAQCTQPRSQPLLQKLSIQGDTLKNASTTPDSIAKTMDGIALKDYLMGRFEPAKLPDFVQIKAEHGAAGIYLRQETYAAFVKMYDAAEKEGVTLHILSGTRTFYAQKSIWEAKWTGKRILDGGINAAGIKDPAARARKILLFSAMPGASRHHWGTDMDLNDLNNSYFDTPKGKKIYAWLTAHASEYGFCQVYTAKGPDRPQGYEEERWHWSYLPLSQGFTKAYAQNITDADIQGFEGAETAAAIQILQNYVLGIATACK